MIRDAILSGRLAPGSPLREAHVALELGVSRSPLREALRRLEEDGLVEKVAFRGTFVADVRPQTVREIAALRLLLEPYAVRQAADQLDAGHGRPLRTALTALRKASKSAAAADLIESHLAFHRLFYELSGNQLLQEMWAGWETKLRLFLIADHQAFAEAGDVVKPHEELAAVIQAGSAGDVAAAIRRHVHEAPGRGAGGP
jgi:DNA-binding GntR family transcriptional regulator